MKKYVNYFFRPLFDHILKFCERKYVVVQEKNFNSKNVPLPIAYLSFFDYEYVDFFMCTWLCLLSARRGIYI